MNTNELTKIITSLYKALDAARDHLDYCGYGDSYEHECAMEQGLPDQINEALTSAHDAMPSLHHTV